MKCFYFSNGEEEESVGSWRKSRVSWARSLSVMETRRRELSETVEFEEFLAQRRANELRVFSLGALKWATRGFSRGLLVGEGGFGSVYRGVVEEMEVAIKQLNRNGEQGHKEWLNEVNLLGVVKHPNLVRLLGYCADDDERGIQRLLVYEFMPNKSLEHHLFPRPPSPILPLPTRFRIAHDAARGLAYLHEQMDFQLIFRDFKTSNILLDDNFNAKLSDFGLARQGPPQGSAYVSTAVVGTIGYAAPEYVQTGKLTAKSDVWSFGVVLYELITGRRALERNLPRNEQKLLDWVRPYVSDPRKFHHIVDPRLQGQYCIKSAHKLAILANKCLMKHPKSRPKMSEVVESLGTIINSTLPPDEEKDYNLSLQPEPSKQANSYLKKVCQLKDTASLRNKSIGRLDWKSWAPGIVRTTLS
ncbi:hypothetical protein VNO78_05525 [Psophocarpus tetragonolobus]|uniref:Protein kinase domain-containing protein n=1 Tax=Psophocarpus tetragonolobus TaxID=3891 RepID=A0AAN9XQH2_PSOTE